jgi:hypothetical protein
VVGLKHATTGDTICDPSAPVVLEQLPEQFPAAPKGCGCTEAGGSWVSLALLVAALVAVVGLAIEADVPGLRTGELVEIARDMQLLEEVTLRNLRLGRSSVDLMLRRHGHDVSIQVLRNEGQIRIAAVY